MKRRSGKLTRHNLDIAAAAPFWAEQVPIGAEAILTDLIGWRDAQGNIRRLRATYDNGWQAEVFFTLPRNGNTSVSSYRLHWRGRIAGSAAA